MEENMTIHDVQPSRVADLLERRSLLQGWLDRLNSQAGSVSDRVLSRVREDYESRLQKVMGELTTHRQGLQAELRAVTDRLAEAEARVAESGDRLEEGRLRNAIGEIPDEEWSRQSRQLEEAVAAAEHQQRSASQDVARLGELLDQIDERTVEAPPEPSAAPAAEGGRAITSDALVEEVEQLTDAHDVAGSLRMGRSGPFLDRIDRTLVGPFAEAPLPVTGEVEEAVDTAPKPGLKCGECGYTNDLSAWFCGVCGADVG